MVDKLTAEEMRGMSMREIRERIDEALAQDAQTPLTRRSSDEEAEEENGRTKRKRRHAIRQYLHYQDQLDANGELIPETMKGLRGRIPLKGEGEKESHAPVQEKRDPTHRIEEGGVIPTRSESVSEGNHAHSLEEGGDTPISSESILEGNYASSIEEGGVTPHMEAPRKEETGSRYALTTSVSTQSEDPVLEDKQGRDD